MGDRLAHWIDRCLAISTHNPATVDVIFCFAGRECRKLYACELFASKAASRLILSTGRFELRRYADLPGMPHIDLLAIAASVPPRLRHYFVLVYDGRADAQLITTGSLGTFSEVVALSDWLKGHREINSVALVSSANHLRRIRFCWRLLAPREIRADFIAAPDEEAPQLRTLFAEVGKFLLYFAALPVHVIARRFSARTQGVYAKLTASLSDKHDTDSQFE